MIVLEEEVIVAVDLLFFFDQTLAAVDADPTLMGISGWNEHGDYYFLLLGFAILLN